MGMFDNVFPECVLPDAGAARVREWQTKSFDEPFLRKYRITADGKLLREVVRYEDRSDPTAEPGSLASFAGCMTPVHERWEPLAFTGTVNFYGTPEYGMREWIEYDAAFVDGVLTQITRIPDEPPATTPAEGTRDG